MVAKKSSKSDRKQRKERIFGKALRFYQTYTSGLKAGDFKNLFTSETESIYTRFHEGEDSSKEKDGVKKWSKIIGKIFYGFLLALTPARRILYGLAFTIFFFSFVVNIIAPYSSEIRQDLTTLSVWSFIIVSFLLALELADKLSAKDEIDIAREVQLSLLPPEEPNLPGLRIATFSAPAAEVGGDYYDFSSTNGNPCLAIGDVSGHGVASGIVMAMAKSAWRTQLRNDGNAEKVLPTLNTTVFEAGNSRTLMTFLHCCFDIGNGTASIANAGHIYPLHYSQKTGELNWIETPSAYPLGVREEQKFSQVSINLSNNDLLIFISDGVVEAADANGESYGYDRMLNSVKNNVDNDVKVVLDRLLDDIQKFVGNTPREDDTTVVVARYQV